MISLPAVLGVALVALAMVLTPGPNMLYFVSRTVSQGRRAGLISVLGVGVGFLVYLALAAFGLAAVFAAVPTLYTVVKLAGAVYLAWLAWKVLRPGGRSAFEPTELPRDRPLRLFTMGLITNLLNPKIALMYLALLPQFIEPARGPVWWQSLQLGAVQIAVAMTVDVVIVLLAGAIGAFLSRRPTWMRVQRWVTGGALGALAVSIALDRGRPATP